MKQSKQTSKGGCGTHLLHRFIICARRFAQLICEFHISTTWGYKPHYGFSRWRIYRYDATASTRIDPDNGKTTYEIEMGDNLTVWLKGYYR